MLSLLDHTPTELTDTTFESPTPARMHDYLLGGSHNFAADRTLADQLLRAWPECLAVVQAERAFLRRAVTFLCDQGVDQFLDLGSGIPAGGSVHDVVSGIRPTARVVCVESDPVAAALGQVLVAGTSTTIVLNADLRKPATVLGSTQLGAVLDLDRPLAVVMIGALPFVADGDDPTAILADYRRASAPGSYLAMSHVTADHHGACVRRAQAVYERSTMPLTARSHEGLLALLDGYDLVDPGLVGVMRWRPEPGEPPSLSGRHLAYAAIGRRP